MKFDDEPETCCLLDNANDRRKVLFNLNNNADEIIACRPPRRVS